MDLGQQAQGQRSVFYPRCGYTPRARLVPSSLLPPGSPDLSWFLDASPLPFASLPVQQVWQRSILDPFSGLTKGVARELQG